MRREAGAAWLLLLSIVLSPGLAAAGKARVAVFLLPAKGYTPQLVARVSSALQTALAADARLDVKDADKLLVEFSGEIPNDRIDQARTAYDEGLERLRNGKAADAIPRLEEAVTTYEEVLGFIKKDLLARACLALGVAQAAARQPRKAYNTFVELLTWRPSLAYDASLFNAAHLPLFERALSAVKKQKRGSVELLTEPPGARAFVDGRFMGITPTVVFGLRVGQHFATYKQEGFIRTAQKIAVSGVEQKSYTTQLRQSDKVLLIQQALESIKAVLGQPVASAEMLNLQTVLFVDQVVFVTMKQAGESRSTLDAFLYDLRSKLRLNSVSHTVQVRTLQEISTLARDLYLKVRTDGTIDAPPEAPPPPPPKRKRFYKKWWFWSAIVVGAAAVALPAALWPRSQSCEAGGPGCRWGGWTQ